MSCLNALITPASCRPIIFFPDLSPPAVFPRPARRPLSPTKLPSHFSALSLRGPFHGRKPLLQTVNCPPFFLQGSFAPLAPSRFPVLLSPFQNVFLFGTPFSIMICLKEVSSTSLIQKRSSFPKYRSSVPAPRFSVFLPRFLFPITYTDRFPAGLYRFLLPQIPTMTPLSLYWFPSPLVSYPPGRERATPLPPPLFHFCKPSPLISPSWVLRFT